MYLIVDVGGTKIRFAPVSKSLRIKRVYTYFSKDFKDFYQAVHHFLKEASLKGEINKVILAVAGPVINGTSVVTNLKWTIRKNTLEKKFDFKEVILLNDLEAMAWSYDLLKLEDFWWIQNGKTKRYPALFIAPGTGLGVSFISKSSCSNALIFPTEAGHTPFSPLNEEEFEFIRFLRKKKKNPSWENALSGRALSFWYEFFSGEKLSPQEVTSLALERDKLAKKAVKKIVELLGRKCASMALSVLPRGGIYLSGGLVNGLTEFFLKKSYLKNFLNGYFTTTKKLSYLLKSFPIALIVPQNPVILGGLSILRSQLK
jgi:glucokinase